jgi:hypothetical protein
MTPNRAVIVRFIENRRRILLGEAKKRAPLGTIAVCGTEIVRKAEVEATTNTGET